MTQKGRKLTFALFFGNRGFFPAEVIAEARGEVCRAVEAAGFRALSMQEDKTRYGAVETIREGKLYADFLEENRGGYDGIILCLPNFGDENGVLAAMRHVDVPILVQAYPDRIGKMDFSHRRDAMCGKLAVCNVLRQAGIPYTLTEKFVVDPTSESFQKDLERFAAICRVVRGMKHFNIGAIGARTTAFKTVRVDEAALQRKGVNLETLDLSEIFERMKDVPEGTISAKREQILAIAEFSGYPEEKLNNMARLQAVLEDVVRDYDLQAVAIRCWNEFETILGIAPCTSLSLLNEMGIPAACEVDVTNAVMMRALALAAETPGTLLDVNNNYGEDSDKVIMFHCGPVPPFMLEGKGKIVEHLMFKKSYGDGCGVGVNKGRMKPGPVTFGSIKTENGRVCGFITEGRFTDDPIEEEFFGNGKVVERENLNAVTNYMACNGYKHHVCVTYGNHAAVIREAFTKYLDFDCVAL